MVCPSNRPCVIARRMIFRRTYPRPSFDGNTPSEIRNVAAREWSAITRREAADCRTSRALLGLDGSETRPHTGSGQFGRACDQRREQIRIVIRNHALQHRRHPLQAHAGIDRRLGQRIQLAAGIAVELHEDEVPQLNIASAVAAKLAIRVALVGRRHAHVVVDLAAGTAGAGVAHLPEIVFQAELEDALFRYALAEP